MYFAQKEMKIYDCRLYVSGLQPCASPHKISKWIHPYGPSTLKSPLFFVYKREHVFVSFSSFQRLRFQIVEIEFSLVYTKTQNLPLQYFMGLEMYCFDCNTW